MPLGISDRNSGGFSTPWRTVTAKQKMRQQNNNKNHKTARNSQFMPGPSSESRQ